MEGIPRTPTPRLPSLKPQSPRLGLFICNDFTRYPADHVPPVWSVPTRWTVQCAFKAHLQASNSFATSKTRVNLNLNFGGTHLRDV